MPRTSNVDDPLTMVELSQALRTQHESIAVTGYLFLSCDTGHSMQSPISSSNLSDRYVLNFQTGGELELPLARLAHDIKTLLKTPPIDSLR